eukprot:302830-Prymnesium_polylepis.2
MPVRIAHPRRPTSSDLTARGLGAPMEKRLSEFTSARLLPSASRVGFAMEAAAPPLSPSIEHLSPLDSMMRASSEPGSRRLFTLTAVPLLSESSVQLTPPLNLKSIRASSAPGSRRQPLNT